MNRWSASPRSPSSAHPLAATPHVSLPNLTDVWSESRRKAFLLACPFILAGCVAGVLFQLPDVNPLDFWMLLALAATLLVLAPLVWARKLRVESALTVSYTLGAAYFLAMLGNQYAFNVGREERLSEATYWFPALYCVAFLAWELPRAAQAAAVPYVLSVLITAAFVPVFEARGEWTVRLASILVHFLLSQGVLIVFFTSFAFLKQRLAQIKALVYIDFLTSLPNRRFAEEQVRALSGGAYSVVMFDVDHFKRVNDTYGHHVGDHVLRELSLVAGRFVQGGALLARWGGEEFVVLLPGAHEEDAARLMERVRAAFEAHTFEEVGCVTASFGVAERRPGEDFHAALQRADAALYEAKRGGRNQVVSARALQDQPDVALLGA